MLDQKLSATSEKKLKQVKDSLSHRRAGVTLEPVMTAKD